MHSNQTLRDEKADDETIRLAIEYVSAADMWLKVLDTFGLFSNEERVCYRNMKQHYTRLRKRIVNESIRRSRLSRPLL